MAAGQAGVLVVARTGIDLITELSFHTVPPGPVAFGDSVLALMYDSHHDRQRPYGSTGSRGVGECSILPHPGTSALARGAIARRHRWGRSSMRGARRSRLRAPCDGARAYLGRIACAAAIGARGPSAPRRAPRRSCVRGDLTVPRLHACHRVGPRSRIGAAGEGVQHAAALWISQSGLRISSAAADDKCRYLNDAIR
jgi:hypothetical protein